MIVGTIPSTLSDTSVNNNSISASQVSTNTGQGQQKKVSLTSTPNSAYNYYTGNAGTSDIGEWLGIGSARVQRAYNSAEAERQREWEEYMSNTAYQRATEDLQKAGLNKILAYTQGPASTPQGSNAHATNSGGEGINSLMNLITTAIKVLTNKNEKTVKIIKQK